MSPPILLERTTKNSSHQWKAVYRCACGELFERQINSVNTGLRRGSSVSCGCLQKQEARLRKTTHGKSRNGNLTYTSWRMMKVRCGSPKYTSYDLYGGRGIVVCDRWLSSFENFLADMGERPTKDHVIDRINRDGNYEPGNCRWITRSENGRRAAILQWEKAHVR